MKILSAFVVREVLMRLTIRSLCLIFLIIFVQTIIIMTITMNAVCDLINRIDKSNDRFNHVTTTTISFIDTNNHSHRNVIFKLVLMISNSMINVSNLSFYFLFRISKFFVFSARVFIVVFFVAQR